MRATCGRLEARAAPRRARLSEQLRANYGARTRSAAQLAARAHARRLRAGPSAAPPPTAGPRAVRWLARCVTLIYGRRAQRTRLGWRHIVLLVGVGGGCGVVGVVVAGGGVVVVAAVARARYSRRRVQVSGCCNSQVASHNTPPPLSLKCDTPSLQMLHTSQLRQTNFLAHTRIIEALIR